MSPEDYDAWYDTPRGSWIGETEYRLAHRLLAPHAGESLLDVGCGTGWFSRRFAADGLAVTGIDPNPGWVGFARGRSPDIEWLEGDARALPFAEAGFDRIVSIAALCFVEDERQALAEIVRVARQRFVVGWLNRSSLLYCQKGRDRAGAYRGAQWHNPDEVRELFTGLPMRSLVIRSAVFLPDGGVLARGVEKALPNWLPYGALILASGQAVHG